MGSPIIAEPRITIVLYPDLNTYLPIPDQQRREPYYYHIWLFLWDRAGRDARWFPSNRPTLLDYMHSPYEWFAETGCYEHLQAFPLHHVSERGDFSNLKTINFDALTHGSESCADNAYYYGTGYTAHFLSARNRHDGYLLNAADYVNGAYVPPTRWTELEQFGFTGSSRFQAWVPAQDFQAEYTRALEEYHRLLTLSPDQWFRQLRQGRISGQVTDRKTRLLLCAGVRQGVGHLLADARSRAAIEAAERFADGDAAHEELQAASSEAAAALDEARTSLVDNAYEDPTQFSACFAARAVTAGLEDAPYGVAWQTDPTMSQYGTILLLDYLLVQLFADVVGPETLPAIDPAWLRWHDGTIPRLAQAIYDSRCFTDLPILADALEEANCQDAAILGHLRGPGPHARGCWPVDLLLGKR